MGENIFPYKSIESEHFKCSGYKSFVKFGDDNINPNRYLEGRSFKICFPKLMTFTESSKGEKNLEKFGF